jgi:hypothetical protein
VRNRPNSFSESSQRFFHLLFWSILQHFYRAVGSRTLDFPKGQHNERMTKSIQVSYPQEAACRKSTSTILCPERRSFRLPSTHNTVPVRSLKMMILRQMLSSAAAVSASQRGRHIQHDVLVPEQLVLQNQSRFKACKRVVYSGSTVVRMKFAF